MNPLAGIVALAGLARLAAEALPSGEVTPSFPSTVYLLRPEDYAHPSKVAQVRAEAEARGGRWVIIGEDWRPLGFFATAERARVVLQGAGFKGPGARGLYSVWRR